VRDEIMQHEHPPLDIPFEVVNNEPRQHGEALKNHDEMVKAILPSLMEKANEALTDSRTIYETSSYGFGQSRHCKIAVQVKDKPYTIFLSATVLIEVDRERAAGAAAKTQL
jgi:hypothetical protein